jgi:hypothetical protein
MLYRGTATAEVSFQATTAVPSVTVGGISVQFAVHEHEAREFERLALGEASFRPAMLPPTVTGEPLPMVEDEPSSMRAAPHMLKDLRGAGFGVLRKLPGGSDAVDVVRDLIQAQGVNISAADHALEYMLGQEALEALDLSGLVHGVRRTLTVGAVTIDVAIQVRSDRGAAASLHTIRGLTINLRSLSGVSSSTNRVAQTTLRGALGGRARLTLSDKYSLDIGAVEVTGSRARSRSQSVIGNAVGYVRTESGGEAEDYVEPIQYDIAVRVTRHGLGRKGELHLRTLTGTGQSAPPASSSSRGGTWWRRWSPGSVTRPSWPGWPAARSAARSSLQPPRVGDAKPDSPYTAVVSVAHEVLPELPHGGVADEVRVRVFDHRDVADAWKFAPHLRPPLTRHLGGRDALRFHELERPAAGVYPVIAAMPELAQAVATMVARASRRIRADEHITELIDVPEQIADVTSPLFLQSHLIALTSADGVVVALEPDNGPMAWVKPQAAALRIRVRMYDVADINAGTGKSGPQPVEVERYISNTLGAGQQDSRESAAGIAAAVGLRVKIQNKPVKGILSNNASARPISHAGVHVGLSGGLTAKRQDASELGSVQVSRATYKQANPASWDRAASGPIEHSRTLLLKAGLWIDVELVVKTRALPGPARPASVHVRADNAINMLVPVPLARTLFPDQLPAGLRDGAGQVTHGRTYVDPESAIKLSSAESLSARDVLPAITQILNRHGIKDSAAAGETLRPTGELHQQLLARFSESALEQQFLQLVDGGVLAWIPRRTGFGTLYLGIEVSAELEPADGLGVSARPQTRLMVRTEPTESQSVLRQRGSDWRAGFGASAIGVFGNALFGSAVATGLRFQRSFASAESRIRTDFYRFTSTSGTYAFTHPLKFRIRIGASWNAPELFRRPAKGLRWLLLPGPDHPLGERLSWAPLAWQDADDTVRGEVTMLVLDSLTRPVTDGESPMAPASSGVPVLRTGQWLGQGKAGARRKPANDELMKLHFLPLTFPAAPVVRGLVPWLLAPRLRSEEPGKDVTRARPGHDLGHLREIRLAALASPAMLAAQVHALLSAPGYRFTVSGQQQVTMQINLTGIRYLSAESRIKDRFYSQDELSSVTSTSRAVGAGFQVTPEFGGYSAEVFEGSLGLSADRERQRELGGDSAEIHEYDVETTRGFHYLSVDIQFNLDAGTYGGVTGQVNEAIRLAIPEEELTTLVDIARRSDISLTDMPGRFQPNGTEKVISKDGPREEVEPGAPPDELQTSATRPEERVPGTPGERVPTAPPEVTEPVSAGPAVGEPTQRTSVATRLSPQRPARGGQPAGPGRAGPRSLPDEPRAVAWNVSGLGGMLGRPAWSQPLPVPADPDPEPFPDTVSLRDGQDTERVESPEAEGGPQRQSSAAPDVGSGQARPGLRLGKSGWAQLAQPEPTLTTAEQSAGAPGSTDAAVDSSAARLRGLLAKLALSDEDEAGGGRQLGATRYPRSCNAPRAGVRACSSGMLLATGPWYPIIPARFRLSSPRGT